MSNQFPARRHVTAVLLALLAALLLRSWLQLRLLRDDAAPAYAADLSYLLAIPVFVLLVLPALLADRAELGGRLAWPAPRTVLIALSIGLLLRLAWWLQTIAGAAFGLYRAGGTEPATPLQLHFACPPPGETALALFVTALLVPWVEELVHRAYVQTALHARGAFVAVGLSAAVFALLHPARSWAFAFAAGIVFGVQYWRSGSLWPPVVSHATVNALIVLDWRCLKGRWIPAGSELPLWLPATASTIALLVCAGAIIALLCRDRRRDA